MDDPPHNDMNETDTENGSSRARENELRHIQQLSQQGYQLLREEMLPQAEEKFNEILRHDPDNHYALVGLGDAARKAREFKRASEYYKQCLSTHPNNNYALFGLADCYKAMRQYHHALEVWERYLQIESDNVTILTRVADAYRKVKNFGRSKELYERVLEIEPSNAYALIGLGHLHYDFKEYETALRYWRAMYERSGSDADIRVLTSIGNCYRKLKRFREGRHFFEEALEKQPYNFYALYGMADCCRGMGEQEESLRYWNRILEKDASNKVILTRAGDAYRQMGELAAAEQYYKEALNIEYDVYAVLGLAIIHRQRGETDQAARSLESLVQQEPGNPRLYVELSKTHQVAGDSRASAEAMARGRQAGALPKSGAGWGHETPSSDP